MEEAVPVGTACRSSGCAPNEHLTGLGAEIGLVFAFDRVRRVARSTPIG